MRIWSLHPKYLDKKGLGGVWCETLLAKAVLEGKTKGYQHHPQLNRFRESSDPVQYISSYLGVVYAEASSRGLNYNPEKIGPYGDLKPLTVTKGQLEYEWNWLLSKLKTRTPEWFNQIPKPDLPDTHPIFTVVEGGIASWEVIQTTKAPAKKTPRKKSNSKDADKKLIAEEKTPEPVSTKRKKSSNDKDLKLKTEPEVAKDKQYASGNHGNSELKTKEVNAKKSKSDKHGDSEDKTEPVDAKKTRSSSSIRGNPGLKPEAVNARKIRSSSNNNVKTVTKQVTATDPKVAQTVDRKSFRDRGSSKRARVSSPQVNSQEDAVKKRKKL